MKLRIATRASKLAMTQSEWVASRLRAHRPDLEVEYVTIETRGDRELKKPLAAIGGKGLFVSEVEALVMDGLADIAVHSLKDVPGDVDLPEGYDLLCIPEREDPSDVLVSEKGLSLDELPAGARVGTTSLRREAQLKARRPDLEVHTLRGNVQTRLDRLDRGDFDAIVLAAAGLRRLGLFDARAKVVLPFDICLPAVGQGTLAIEGAVDRDDLRALLAPLECERSRVRMEAERKLLRLLEGSCRSAIAGHASLSEDGRRLLLEGFVGSVDGKRPLRASSEVYLREGEDRVAAARALGEEVAEMLLTRGAREVMRDAEADVLRREKGGNGGGQGGDRFKWR
ncbi:MAG: hydroxymethylbilane synthase [Myxococcales bacterium]|nr:hydroxymethylbilane synthase [Myxococcales bacterium]